MKGKYADGNEYFIYTGEIGSNKNLLNLLKAFSAFKKRQKSNMQLLIAGKPGWKYEEFLENLRLFRFKEEVKLLEYLPLPEARKSNSISLCNGISFTFRRLWDTAIAGNEKRRACYHIGSKRYV